LLHYRPDLNISELRGNLDTRLSKLKTHDFDAIILAVAGLKRLEWEGYITQIIPKSICLPAVGQGALAIEARAHDHEVLSLIAFLNHQATNDAVTAERAYLRKVEGGCQIPIGVYATVDHDFLSLEAVILSVDGKEVVRDTISGTLTEAEKLGNKLAQRMLDAGGREILAKL
jgi:hydroxymethylbilane synthase